MNNLQPKPYDIAFLCGRFQLMHIGHESLVDTALKMCDRILILVGSAQEIGTERNPFDIGTRIKMIKEIYPQENVIVKPLSDLTNENDIRPEWGKYLLDRVKNYVYKVPELMIYGNDESRSKWFDSEDIKDVTEIIVPRSRLPISATMLREALLKDDKETWFEYHNPRLHKYYDVIRGQLLTAEPYSKKYKEMMNI
ncbi:MAG: adenylyltransferase/cytidyltransferase family protein [Romboutsia sp.]